MCPDCFNAHQLLSATFEGHKVTPVKEFKEEDYEALLKRQPFCAQQFHEREITRFFCATCEASICQICIATDHQNHKVILLDKAAHDEKQNIKAGAEKIKERENELREVIRDFEETSDKLVNNATVAKREISEACERMIAKLREREQDAVASVENTSMTRLEKINSAKQDAQSLVKQMSQAVEFAENLAQNSSSSDIMQNKDTLKQRFEKLGGTAFPQHHKTAFVKFSAASTEDLKLGAIQTTDTETDGSQLVRTGLAQAFCRLV